MHGEAIEQRQSKVRVALTGGLLSSLLPSRTCTALHRASCMGISPWYRMDRLHTYLTEGPPGLPKTCDIMLKLDGLQELVRLCDNVIAETAGFSANVNTFLSYLKVHRIPTVPRGNCVTYCHAVSHVRRPQWIGHA